MPSLYNKIKRRKSKRIFMLGVGPSLREQADDLALLEKEHTFACNRMPLWKELPFTPTYYGLTEPMNAQQIEYYDRITSERWGDKVQRFVIHPEQIDKPGWTWIQKEKDEGPLAMRLHGLTGFGDTLAPLKTGRTSPLTLLQVAAWMGYREFYFLGIDFWPKGYCFDPEADPGVTVHERTLKGVADSLRVAKQVVEENGGIMVDCTYQGKMNKVLGYKPLSEVI